MKKYTTVMFIAFFITNAMAQKEEIKQNLIQKWKFNLELMKPTVEKILSENPEMANVDELDKAMAMDSALSEMAQSSIEYIRDGTLIKTTSDGSSAGTWKYDDQLEVLIAKTKKEPEKRFKIIELDKTKLHLKTQDNRDVFFVPK